MPRAKTTAPTTTPPNYHTHRHAHTPQTSLSSIAFKFVFEPNFKDFSGFLGVKRPKTLNFNRVYNKSRMRVGGIRKVGCIRCNPSMNYSRNTLFLKGYRPFQELSLFEPKRVFRWDYTYKNERIRGR